MVNKNIGKYLSEDTRGIKRKTNKAHQLYRSILVNYYYKEDLTIEQRIKKLADIIDPEKRLAAEEKREILKNISNTALSSPDMLDTKLTELFEKPTKAEEEAIEAMNEYKIKIKMTQYLIMATESAIIDKIKNSIMLDKIKLPKNLREKYGTMVQYIDEKSKIIDSNLENLGGKENPMLQEYNKRYELISNNFQSTLIVSPRKLNNNIRNIYHINRESDNDIFSINDIKRRAVSHVFKRNRQLYIKAIEEYRKRLKHQNFRDGVSIANKGDKHHNNKAKEQLYAEYEKHRPIDLLHPEENRKPIQESPIDGYTTKQQQIDGTYQIANPDRIGNRINKPNHQSTYPSKGSYNKWDKYTKSGNDDELEI